VFFDAATKISRQSATVQPSFFRPVISGVKVDDESAFTYSAFYSCMRIISETIAYLPWHVNLSGTKRQIATDHPLDNILYSRPNAELNAFQFKELMIQHRLGWGNGYAEIERNRAGEIVNLWPVDPACIEPARDNKGRLVYEYSGNGINKTIQPRHIFHVRGPSRDGVHGYSIIELAKESLGIGLAAESFGAAFFGNGAFPASVITNDGSTKMSPEGVTNLLKTFNKRNKGSRNAMRTEYLDPGMQLKVVGVPPKDAQFLETRKFQISEICRWFRIPPHKLADLERSTHSNIEAQNIEFVTDAIVPDVTRLEQQANFSLLQDSNYYTKINVMGLLRGDSKARSEYYKTLSNLGVLTINDILSKEDMDDIGELGDTRLVQMNMATLERIKSGDLGNNKATGALRNAIQETAQRFAKIEIKTVAKLAEKGAKEDIASFYVRHCRNLRDGFDSVCSAYCAVVGAAAVSLEQFFGHEIEKSADQVQNAMERGELNALFCSWEARKADNLTRDLIEFIGSGVSNV
jgi:HK97 family phage portal protein